MLYIRKFDNHEEYENFVSGDTMVRPNVSRCMEENHVHYNPISYVYMRSNYKSAENTVKIKYENGMKLNVMDYITIASNSANTAAYCGYALIENTNIGDATRANPSVTQPLTENGYSFTPQEGKTYAVIQQAPSGTNGILSPFTQYVKVTATDVLTNYFLIFYVPNTAMDVGMVINGVNYSYSSSSVTVSNRLIFGSVVIERANSYVVYKDVLDILKNGETVNILPYMVTPDGVMVEARNYGKLTISENADLANLKTEDVTYSGSTINPNYPNFITPPTQGE